MGAQSGPSGKRVSANLAGQGCNSIPQGGEAIMGLPIGAGGETYKPADIDPDSLLYLEHEVARIEHEVARRREAQEAALAEIRDLGT